MRGESRWASILFLVAIGLAQAHMHMMRMILRLIIILGGMYMLHVLAQDFNKIRKGWPFPQRPGRLLGLVKRSADDDVINGVEAKKQWLAERLTNETRQFPDILRNDPMGCARKYVCHISGRSRAKISRAADNVLILLRAFKWLDISGEWTKAEELGKTKGQEGACEKEYSKCYFTGVQLDKFMNLF